jgi:hypothetical protein
LNEALGGLGVLCGKNRFGSWSETWLDLIRIPSAFYPWLPVFRKRLPLGSQLASSKFAIAVRLESLTYCHTAADKKSGRLARNCGLKRALRARNASIFLGKCVRFFPVFAIWKNYADSVLSKLKIRRVMEVGKNRGWRIEDGGWRECRERRSYAAENAEVAEWEMRL